MEQNNLFNPTTSKGERAGAFAVSTLIQKADFDKIVYQKRKPVNYILHIISGVAEIVINDQQLSVKEGDLILVPKNNELYLLSAEDFKATSIIFNDQFLQSDSDDLFIFLLFNLFKPNLFVHNLKTKESSRLEILFSILMQEYNISGKNNKEIINHLFKAILLKIESFTRASNPLPLAHNDTDHSIFLNFRKLLEMHFKSSWTVENYAKSLNISTKKLLEVTRRVSGETPSGMIKNRKIDEAKNLLKKNKYSIKEIANILGFEYAANFSQYFKKFTNISPRNYRNSTS